MNSSDCCIIYTLNIRQPCSKERYTRESQPNLSELNSTKIRVGNKDHVHRGGAFLINTERFIIVLAVIKTCQILFSRSFNDLVRFRGKLTVKIISQGCKTHQCAKRLNKRTFRIPNDHRSFSQTRGWQSQRRCRSDIEK